MVPATGTGAPGQVSNRVCFQPRKCAQTRILQITHSERAPGPGGRVRRSRRSPRAVLRRSASPSRRAGRTNSCAWPSRCVRGVGAVAPGRSSSTEFRGRVWTGASPCRWPSPSHQARWVSQGACAICPLTRQADKTIRSGPGRDHTQLNGRFRRSVTSITPSWSLSAFGVPDAIAHAPCIEGLVEP